MRFLISNLFLASLCAVSSRSVSSSGTMSVIQSPDVSVMEGETVNITCCWEGEIDRIWLTWMKGETSIAREFFDWKKTSPDCSILRFSNIRREDSGRYTCNIFVEIPSLFRLEGNGTLITVTARDNRANDPGPLAPITGGFQWEKLIFFLRCLPILALVVSFFFLYNLATKARQNTAAATGSELPSSQQLEDDHEDEERDQRKAE